MGLRNLLTDLSGVINNDASIDYPSHNTFNNAGLSIFDNPYGNSNFGFRQKNIPFGRDTKGGGDSGQPFIQRAFGQFGNVGVNHTPLDEGINAIITGNVIDADVRGGLTTYNNRRHTDLVRFNKWLDTPQGRQWNSTQLLLQANNPKPNKPVTSFSNQLSFKDMFNQITDISPNQTTWNLGLNTATQIKLGSNLHIPREGVLPYLHNGYVDYAKEAFTELKEQTNSRLLSLSKKTGHYGVPSEGGSGFLGWLQDAGSFINNTLNKLGGRGEELYSYGGGPGAGMGLGRTFIGRYTNTRIDNYGIEFPFQPGYTTEIEDEETEEVIGTEQRRQFPDSSKNNIREGDGTGWDYTGYDLGNPGVMKDPDSNFSEVATDGVAYGGYIRQTDENLSTYNVYNVSKTDKINMIDVFTKKKSELDTTTLPKDFIKFRIEAINSASPDKSDYIVFRALLDDMSDSYAASHNSYTYNGRPETFYTYKGFKRDISISFKIAAQTRHEMMPLYRKLNYLVSQTAPDYSTSRMMTPYVRLTVGDWIARTPGVISSIGLKWNKEYPWETRLLDQSDDLNMLELPHILDVSMKFIPIHNFTPAKGISKPFILPHINDVSLNEGQKWYSLSATSDANEAQKPFLDKKTVTTKGYPLGGTMKPHPVIVPENEGEGKTISREQVAKATNKNILNKLSKGLKKVKNILH
tara:strand:+ start:5358 stop:7430 length:2073 start_codon:yes stop_codon:yes gene_type:complete